MFSIFSFCSAFFIRKILSVAVKVKDPSRYGPHLYQTTPSVDRRGLMSALQHNVGKQSLIGLSGLDQLPNTIPLDAE